MFKILMNGTVVDSVREFGGAVRKALKIRELFCKSGVITIEDPKGFVIYNLGGYYNVFKG